MDGLAGGLEATESVTEEKVSSCSLYSSSSEIKEEQEDREERDAGEDGGEDGGETVRLQERALGDGNGICEAER
jgi:hypothetical protein